MPFIDDGAPVFIRCQAMAEAFLKQEGRGPVRWWWNVNGTTDRLRTLLQQRRPPVVAWYEKHLRSGLVIGYHADPAAWIIHDPLFGPGLWFPARQWSKLWLARTDKLAGGHLMEPIA